MRAVIQRVTSSKVSVDNKVIGSINKGFNILVGFSTEDTVQDLNYIKDKVLNLRVFEDNNKKMNLSVLDVEGEILVISQFTLYGDCRKGRRPNFMNAMSPDKAIDLYNEFIKIMKDSKIKIETGEFGADMKVDIQNDGPVTILIDSEKRF